MADKQKLTAEEWKALEHAEWRGAIGEKLEHMQECLLDVKHSVFGDKGKGLLERVGALEAKVKGAWAVLITLMTAAVGLVVWALRLILSGKGE